MQSTLWLSILVGYIIGAVAAALVLPPAAVEAVALPVGVVTCMLVAATVVAAAVERTRSVAAGLGDLIASPLPATGMPPGRSVPRFDPVPAGTSTVAWTAPRPVVVASVEPGALAAGRWAGRGGAWSTDSPVEVAPQGDAAGLSAEEVRRAIAEGRVEVFVQPTVVLPQRRAVFYEGLTRVRDHGRGLVPPPAYLATAERAGVIGRIDLTQILGCARLALLEAGPGRQPGFFCNISPASLDDPGFIHEVTAFLAGAPALARRLVLELAGARLDGRAWRALGTLRGFGIRLSLDPPPGGLDAAELARRGVAFVKLGAERFEATAGLSRPDPELVGLIEGFRAVGIEPIVNRIESERTLLEVLDYRVRYGQGGLFGAPVPVAGPDQARER
ncbi:MAG TPA: EAL domain-containing protein [Geminicoccaceae bacterium]|nr:EAL domain-containing protein [Geminicoccaceae bacterium]